MAGKIGRSRNGITGVWPEARVALLRELWGEGVPARAIAAMLGATTTKMAVIGKARRLGLAERSPRGFSSAWQKRHRGEKKSKAASPRRFGPATAVPREKSPPAFRTHPLPFPQPEDIPRIAFTDLEDRHCRYPCLLEPGAPDVPQFCGKPKISGSSYCWAHKRVCEGVPVSRRVRLPSEAPALVFGASKFEIEAV